MQAVAEQHPNSILKNWMILSLNNLVNNILIKKSLGTMIIKYQNYFGTIGRFCAVTKIGIKRFSRFLLVGHGRKPSKPHFHGPIRW